MPLGFIGGLVSKGIAFLLTVMCGFVERLLGFLAAHALREHVDQQQMRIGAAGDDAEPGVDQRRGQRRRVRHAPAADTRRTPASSLRGSRPPWPRSRAPAARPACRGIRSCRWPAPYLLAVARIMPERGPRRVLCVVEVTMSAYSHGLGCTPAATSPEKCAMSTSKIAPTESAICAEAREIDDARIGAAARDDHLRLVLFGQPRQLVVVDALVVLAHAVGHDLVRLAREIQLDARASGGRRAPDSCRGSCRPAAARRRRPPGWPATRNAAAR